MTLPLWFKVLAVVTIGMWAYFAYRVYAIKNWGYSADLLIYVTYALIIVYPLLLATVTFLIARGHTKYWSLVIFFFLLVGLFIFYKMYAPKMETYYVQRSFNATQQEYKVIYDRELPLAKFSYTKFPKTHLVFLTIAEGTISLYHAYKINESDTTWHYIAPTVIATITEKNTVSLSTIKDEAGVIWNMEKLTEFTNADGKSFTEVYTIIPN